jgi:hypothetical protein
MASRSAPAYMQASFQEDAYGDDFLFSVNRVRF